MMAKTRPKQKDPPRCEQCRYWRENQKGPDYAGYCRRFPIYEMVQPNHWCGEYKPRV